MKYFNWLSIVGGAVGGFFSYCLGGWDLLSKCLIAFMILDYATGIMSAMYTGKLCSSKGFKGIIKKAAIFLTVCMAAVMQEYLSIPIRDVVVTFFVMNEGLSIVENLGEIVEMPPAIKNALHALRGKDDSE